MIFFILILLLIMAGSAKVAEPGHFIEDYISKQKTNAVKGIFVILVLLGHASVYIEKSFGVWDQPFSDLRFHLNQMVVSMFLFYSGFGMMKSIMQKKFNYVKHIPVKRFLIVLLNLDIAVLLFIAMYFFMGVKFDISTILWSLVGWKSVGNSNWYIFMILVLYVLLFVSFYVLRWFDKKFVMYICAVVFTVLSILFVYWEMCVGQPTWCYNTVILFPLGMWYAILQKPIEAIMMKNDYLYSLLCAVLVICYCISYKNRWAGGIEYYSIWAILFTMMVVFFTMKISFDGKILNWFGDHVFSVYILQRIPMIILDKLGVTSDKYIFMVIAIISTIFIAGTFDFFVGKLNKLILKKCLK